MAVAIRLCPMFSTGVIDVQSARLQLSASHFVPVDVHDGEAEIAGDVGTVQVFDGGTVDPLSFLATGAVHALNLNIAQGGVLSLEIGGTSAGASVNGYDQIKVDGTVSLGGVLQLTALSGFTPLPGQKLFLIDNQDVDPINGTFSNAPNGGIFSIGGMSFLVSYVGNAETGETTGGNDLVLTVVPSVPESWASTLGGLGILLLRRRRRRR
jgi:hypothetical protein